MNRSCTNAWTYTANHMVNKMTVVGVDVVLVVGGIQSNRRRRTIYVVVMIMTEIVAVAVVLAVAMVGLS